MSRRLFLSAESVFDGFHEIHANWTARLEYDFLGLNNQTFTVPANTTFGSPASSITITNRDVQTLTVGVNYLFNWNP